MTATKTRPVARPVARPTAATDRRPRPATAVHRPAKSRRPAAGRPESDAQTLARDPLAHALLDAETEVALAKRIEVGMWAARLLAEGRTPAGACEADLRMLVADGEAAHDRFITSNLRLVRSIAVRYMGRGIADEDVIQDGYHGLVKAVHKYDYAKGYRFSTYATWWIRQSILTGLAQASADYRPEELVALIRKVRAVALRMEDTSGVRPSIAEIAAEAEVAVVEVEKAFATDKASVSLDVPVTEDQATLGQILPDGAAEAPLRDIEDDFDQRLMRAAVAAAIDDLPGREGPVLRGRFGFDGERKSLEQMGREMGISRETVRLAEARGLARLRRTPEARALLRPHLLLAG